MDKNLRESLESLAYVTGWTVILGYCVLLVWFAVFVGAGPELCQLHARWFDFTQHECALLHYGGMGFMKILLIVFALMPWLALRMRLRRP